MPAPAPGKIIAAVNVSEATNQRVNNTQIYFIICCNLSLSAELGLWFRFRIMPAKSRTSAGEAASSITFLSFGLSELAAVWLRLAMALATTFS